MEIYTLLGFYHIQLETKKRHRSPSGLVVLLTLEREKRLMDIDYIERKKETTQRLFIYIYK